MVPVDFSFSGRMNAVQAHLREEINFNPFSFEELVKLEMSELDETVNPAIVLAVSSSCADHNHKSEALAGIIQFIYMANKVHRLMKDDSDLREELRQYPVLVGDLLYGKFFLELCREKLLLFLEPLAQVMGSMSQGGISRWLSHGKKISSSELLKIIELESASLTAAAARLSAELAGVAVPLRNKLESFGWELGLAWGAWKENMDYTAIRSILRRIDDILEELSTEAQLEPRPLREVYQYLLKQLNADYNLQEMGL